MTHLFSQNTSLINDDCRPYVDSTCSCLKKSQAASCRGKKMRNTSVRKIRKSVDIRCSHVQNLRSSYFLSGHSVYSYNKRVRPLRGRPLWAVLAVEYVRAVLGLSRSVQGGKGSLRHLPNIKLIGQHAAKLWGFFANNAISRLDLDL